jgi:phosphoglycerate dehydrogenase-like enzyme
MDQPLVIWCNVPFDPTAASSLQRLRDAVDGHTLHLVDRETPAERSRKLFDEASVVFGQPPLEGLLASERIRWIEVSSAGYEGYDRADVRAALARRGVPVTNSSGVYADACAQHALTMMLAACRQLPGAMELQRERRWGFAELRPRMRRLSDQNVLILGWGQIARRLAQLLAPYDVRVTAVRRHVAGDEPIRVITVESLDRALAETDHLVDLLPGGAHTAQFVNAARLACLPRGAWVYNVGRGTTVDQSALAEALASGHLGGAWLDVTDPEPLPPDHPLWRAPGCFITPHLAGGQSDERGHQVRHFVDNLARFVANHPLVDRIW